MDIIRGLTCTCRDRFRSPVTGIIRGVHVEVVNGRRILYTMASIGSHKNVTSWPCCESCNSTWKILIRCVKTSFSWREDCNLSTVRDVQINKCYESKLIVLFMIPAADYLIWMLPWSQESLWRVKSRQGNTQSSKSVESLMNRLGNERVENSLPPSLNNCCLNFSKDPLTFDTRLIINV